MRDALLDVGDLVLDSLLLGEESGEILLGDVGLLLKPSNDLGLHAIRGELGAHPSALDPRTSSRHGSRGVDEFSAQRYDSPALLAVRDPVRLVEILGDQSLPNGLEESRSETCVLRLDEIEQPRNALRSVARPEVLAGKLIEDEDAGSTSGSSQVLDDSLTLLDRVGDESVETSTAGSGDGDVVLVVNDSKVSEAALQAKQDARSGQSSRWTGSLERTCVESVETTHLLQLLQAGKHGVLTLASGQRRLGLLDAISQTRSMLTNCAFL